MSSQVTKRTPTLDLITWIDDRFWLIDGAETREKVSEICLQLREAYESLQYLVPENISLKNQLDACVKERDAALLTCRELREHFQLRNH